MSKMQKIIDRIEQARALGNMADMNDAMIDAIKLLAKGEAQLMHDVEILRDQNTYRTDVPIG